MKEHLITKVEAFYHVTQWSKWMKIKAAGLKFTFGTKGISVLRTDDERIINALIITQLQKEETIKENRWVVLKFNQTKMGLSPQLIKPDLVEDWTWPFHNNLMKSIHKNYIEFIEEFSIEDWDEANQKENKDREEILDSALYKEALKVIYKDQQGKFSYNKNQEKVYLNE